MRPIDADALVADLNNMAEEWIAMEKHVPFEFKQYYRGKFEAVMDIMAQVNRHTPTLDLAPVVHGEWVKDGGCECRCKKCGYAPLYDYFGRVRLSNYCPNCGAKMDGGKENGRNE